MPKVYQPSEFTLQEIDMRFRRTIARADQLPRLDSIQMRAREFAVYLSSVCPPSRELAEAIEFLHLATLIASQSIVSYESPEEQTYELLQCHDCDLELKVSPRRAFQCTRCRSIEFKVPKQTTCLRWDVMDENGQPLCCVEAATADAALVMASAKLGAKAKRAQPARNHLKQSK